MRIAGIIAEYDPFHNGHKAHIEATKAKNGGNATHIVNVISGSFTQRGEPALLSKFRRTEMALANGADLVLELPLPWAMSPAESFAAGGISILNALGCVELLSFGSECGDVNALTQIAALSTNPVYQNALKEALSRGIPYAAAGQAAAETVVGSQAASLLASPNNTLGIEYLRASTAQSAHWDVFTLQRQGTMHGDMTAKDAFASATMLREMVRNGDITATQTYMPTQTTNILMSAHQNGELTTQAIRLQHALMAHLRRLSAEEYANLPWLSEGLENRLYRECRAASDYNTLLNTMKTKRYPMARLKRMLWAALIGLTVDDIAGLPPYIRILGMNERGKEILALASPAIPIISKATQINELDARAQRIFALECIATDLHALAMEQPIPCGSDYTTKMITK